MESIAVPVWLTLELRPEVADIGSRERAISAALADAARKLWSEVIGTLEALLLAERGCSACGGLLKANGRAPRRIVTLAGEVSISRRRYRGTACAAEIVARARTWRSSWASCSRAPSVATRPLEGDVWVSADGTMINDRDGRPGIASVRAVVSALDASALLLHPGMDLAVAHVRWPAARRASARSSRRRVRSPGRGPAPERPA